MNCTLTRTLTPSLRPAPPFGRRCRRPKTEKVASQAPKSTPDLSWLIFEVGRRNEEGPDRVFASVDLDLFRRLIDVQCHVRVTTDRIRLTSLWRGRLGRVNWIEK